METNGDWKTPEPDDDNKYHYNGKEFNDDIGLNWSDYGERWYDAGIGRWISVDSLARDYPWYTLYQFAGNMPIEAIDLDGLEPIAKDGILIGAQGISSTDIVDFNSGKLIRLKEGAGGEYRSEIFINEDIGVDFRLTVAKCDDREKVGIVSKTVYGSTEKTSPNSYEIKKDPYAFDVYINVENSHNSTLMKVSFKTENARDQFLEVANWK